MSQSSSLPDGRASNTIVSGCVSGRRRRWFQLIEPFILLREQERQSLALEHIEPAQDFIQGNLVFQVNLVIEICPQSILRTLPVLRHHDDGRLKSLKDVQNEQEKNVGVRIKAFGQQKIESHPNRHEQRGGGDETPTTTEFGNHVSCPVTDRRPLLLLFVHISRNAL